MNNKLFPAICIALILLWWAWALIYSSQPEEPVLSTYSLDEHKFEVEHMASELLELKWNKQQCKDNLSEYQTIAEYKWVEFYCSMHDWRIEQLKTQLAASLTFPYEQLDMRLDEWVKEKDSKQFEEAVTSLAESESGSKLDGLKELLGLAQSE